MVFILESQRDIKKFISVFIIFSTWVSFLGLNHTSYETYHVSLVTNQLERHSCVSMESRARNYYSNFYTIGPVTKLRL